MEHKVNANKTHTEYYKKMSYGIQYNYWFAPPGSIGLSVPAFDIHPRQSAPGNILLPHQQHQLAALETVGPGAGRRIRSHYPHPYLSEPRGYPGWGRGGHRFGLIMP